MSPKSSCAKIYPMLNSLEFTEFPINSAQGNGFDPKPGIGCQPRFVPFGGGSKSKSSQSTVAKDNSAIVEDQGLNVTDGSRAARAEDEAIAIGQLSQGKGSSVRLDLDKREIEDSQVLEGNSRNVSGNMLGAGGNQSLNNVTIEQLSDDVVRDVLDFGEVALRESFKTGSQGIEEAFASAMRSQDGANQLSRVTNEIIAGIASERTEDSASTVYANLQKNILIAGGMLALTFYFTRK